jgi:predicted dehydrogenase
MSVTSHKSNASIAIVGAGLIGESYANVLIDIGYAPVIVGRGESNVRRILEKHPQLNCVYGGIEKWLDENPAPNIAIVSTAVEDLVGCAETLINAGCKRLLVEKPVTCLLNQARKLATMAEAKKANVYVAFNRRNYASVIAAKKLIQADGGVVSYHFDFTEAVFRIDPSAYTEDTLMNWGIGNSSHVMDTAFFLGGKPKEIECRQYNKDVDWHPAGSIFMGMGITDNNVPFTYHSNWGCPGKWNIEIMTKERKLFFSPMEQLHQQPKNSFRKELVDLDYSIDTNFKPGFYRQVEEFLGNETQKNLFPLEDLPFAISTMKEIMGYD